MLQNCQRTILLNVYRTHIRASTNSIDDYLKLHHNAGVYNGAPTIGHRTVAILFINFNWLWFFPLNIRLDSAIILYNYNYEGTVF